MIIPNIWKNKNVPNHQPENLPLPLKHFRARHRVLPALPIHGFPG